MRATCALFCTGADKNASLRHREQHRRSNHVFFFKLLLHTRAQRLVAIKPNGKRMKQKKTAKNSQRYLAKRRQFICFAHFNQLLNHFVQRVDVQRRQTVDLQCLSIKTSTPTHLLQSFSTTPKQHRTKTKKRRANLLTRVLSIFRKLSKLLARCVLASFAATLFHCRLATPFVHKRGAHCTFQPPTLSSVVRQHHERLGRRECSIAGALAPLLALAFFFAHFSECAMSARFRPFAACALRSPTCAESVRAVTRRLRARPSQFAPNARHLQQQRPHAVVCRRRRQRGRCGRRTSTRWLRGLAQSGRHLLFEQFAASALLCLLLPQHGRTAHLHCRSCT